MFNSFAGALSIAMLLFACQAYARQDGASAELPASPATCESLAAKYPFSPTSETDASLSDIENYLKSVLPETEAHSPPTPQQENHAQLIEWAKAVRETIFRSDWSKKSHAIELRLESLSQNLGSATIFSEDTPVARSFGPRIPYRFTWPSQSQSLSVHTTDLTGAAPVKTEFAGVWALLRLIDAGNQHQITGGSVTFAVEVADNAQIALSIAGANELMDLRAALVCPSQ